MRRALRLASAVLALAAALPARADRLSLEAAFHLSGSFPVGTDVDQFFGAIGFAGEASYEIERWSFGIRTRGGITNNTALHIVAGDYDLDGGLSRRQYGVAALVRYFSSTSTERKKAYLEFGFLGLETDFIHADSILILPQSPNYTRVFLRGAGFTIGAGYRPKEGPWFYQVNYELDHYENLEVTGDVKYLHPILANPAINGNYFIHTVYIYVGLDVFGR